MSCKTKERWQRPSSDLATVGLDIVILQHGDLFGTVHAKRYCMHSSKQGVLPSHLRERVQVAALEVQEKAHVRLDGDNVGRSKANSHGLGAAHRVASDRRVLVGETVQALLVPVQVGDK